MVGFITSVCVYNYIYIYIYISCNSPQKCHTFAIDKQHWHHHNVCTLINFLYYFSQKMPSILPLTYFYPLNSKLNPICNLLALIGAHHILRVSRIRAKHLQVASQVVFICIRYTMCQVAKLFRSIILCLQLKWDIFSQKTHRV